jgi:hypothetical protein
VSALIKDGKTLEAVVASKPTASFDKDWTGGVGLPADMFVTLVYRDLSR